MRIVEVSKWVAAVLILAVGFSMSCKKPEKPEVNYEVTGIKDVTLDQNGSFNLPLSVAPLTDASELVTLSVSGLPEAVSSAFTTTTGQPPFNTELYIKDDSSKGGVYPIMIKSESVSGVQHEYTFNLTTKDKTCGKQLAGKYQATGICDNGSGHALGQVQLTVDPDDVNKLHFMWNGRDVYIEINCNKNQLTLPSQYIGSGLKVSGSGAFDQNYSVIDFSFTERYNSGETVPCKMHMFKL